MVHADNQHIMGSTYQIKEKLKQEIDFLKELRFYLHLLKEEVTHVENFLNNNYKDQGMYKNRVENDRKSFEIPALLSCKRGNSA